MFAKLSSMVQTVANWWSRWTLAQRFAALTAALIAGSAVILIAVLVGVSSHMVSGLERERITQQLDEAAHLFAQRVRLFRRVPLILSGMPPIERIADLSTGGTPREGESLEVLRKRLAKIFKAFVDATPSLWPIRLIGLADGGREIVRVDSAGDEIIILDAADLQRRGDRPYFQEALKLHAGEVYLSPIDANVERGDHRPMIRAATPIFTVQGELFGVIAVNSAPGAWLRDISDLSQASANFIVTDQNGNYLFRSDNGPLVGSISGAGSRFRHDWPQLEAIFYPNDANTMSFTEGGRFVSARRVAYNPTDPSVFAVLVMETPQAKILSRTSTLILLGVVLALALSLFGVIAAYFVSLPLKHLMAAATRIAQGKLDAAELTGRDRTPEIGELGHALRIMKEAVESRDALLRKSDARLRTIVDNTIDGLITIDHQGLIVTYNHGCEAIFGYTIGEAVGQNIGLLLSRSDAALMDDFLNQFAISGKAPFVDVRREFTGRHKSGQPVDIEIALAELNIDGEVLFSTIVRDISERKKTERMKSEFISTVSHELRTPLTSIMGSLGLLRAKALGPLTEKVDRMINLAYDNGARLAKLINDILDIEKIEAGRIEFNKQSENLKALIEQAAQQNTPCAAKYGVTIVVGEVPRDIVVEVDAVRFGEVLDNLISNAAKFSPKGGQIEIAAKMAGRTVRITVTDHGAGIPVAFRKRIFEKFAQADSSDTRQKSGTGLGLSIAKSIVERLDGQIGYETKMGAGTTFYFDLPARRAAPIESSARKSQPTMRLDRNLGNSPEGAGHAARPRVLHVDSDGDVCVVVAESISDVADVTSVPNAEGARKLLSEQRFDLVILAILLPGESGESVLRYLSERETPAPPVLVYSIDDFSMKAWPLVACALVKSHTDTATLRSHILKLLPSAPQPSPIKCNAEVLT